LAVTACDFSAAFECFAVTWLGLRYELTKFIGLCFVLSVVRCALPLLSLIEDGRTAGNSELKSDLYAP
jgi:hypothetical protein